MVVVDAVAYATAIAEAQQCGVPVVCVREAGQRPRDVVYWVPGNRRSRVAQATYLSRLTSARPGRRGGAAAPVAPPSLVAPLVAAGQPQRGGAVGQPQRRAVGRPGGR